jgi:hypothetical protein
VKKFSEQSSERFACGARVSPAPGDWSFRGRDSKLPRHKAQATLRTPKTCHDHA